ncbi:response regulator [Salinarimonas sp. NSM]|uniref:response regulator n=1 Tax=Salinarimonas sp. NSM TaxID=3458003 RepID=UPI004036E0AC
MHTILLVDDDALTAMGSADLIEDLGHTVLTAHSGKEALAIAAERPDLDLVVTDQSMPGMSGVELAKALRAERPALPVILATGYGAPPEGESLPTLPKPYDQAQLDAAIRSALAR